MSTTTSSVDWEYFARLAGDAIVGADARGKIFFWNAAAERVFGHSAEEALGQSLDLIIPERFRARHWEGYRRVMETGKSRYGSEVLRVPALHKEGRQLSIAFTVVLLDPPASESRVIVAVVRDETTRWNEERALRLRLKQLEGA
ncbi:MAG TPA: PAS domain-containing protein [candidate division Zixibacteria bacterium]|nr:PAS domain-containing protein [candidate division Zixibacteria bacterium]